MIRQVNLQAMDPFCTTLTNRIELMALNIENARMYFELIDELKMGSFSIKKVSGRG